MKKHHTIQNKKNNYFRCFYVIHLTKFAGDECFEKRFRIFKRKED